MIWLESNSTPESSSLKSSTIKFYLHLKVTSFVNPKRFFFLNRVAFLK